MHRILLPVCVSLPGALRGRGWPGEFMSPLQLTCPAVAPDGLRTAPPLRAIRPGKSTEPLRVKFVMKGGPVYLSH